MKDKKRKAKKLARKLKEEYDGREHFEKYGIEVPLDVPEELRDRLLATVVAYEMGMETSYCYKEYFEDDKE